MKKTALSSLLLLALLSRGFCQIEAQMQNNWCWAACVQSVVYQAGAYYSQPQIVSVLTGWPQNRPASIDEVVGLCQRFNLRAWRVGRPGTPQELYTSLTSGWKLIAFVQPSAGPVGHYIVLQGLDTAGNITVSNPYTGSTRSTTLAELYWGWKWYDAIVVGR